MKKQPEPLLAVNDQDGEHAIEAMIEQYQNQVRTIQENRANSPYALTPPPTGSLFNIFV
jgi:thioesterase domain-containing protein